jgi:hypothetical protein
MRLPDFLIIGAAKSGTTTLYEYLCRHPQVYMSHPKEPEFFARDDNYARGMDWYTSLFNKAKPHQICGEASTIYTLSPYFPKTAARIAQALPNVKLIYIMRHPVDRAYAYYVQLKKNAQNANRQLKVIKTFEESIKPDGRQSIKMHVPDPAIVDSHLPKVPGLYLDGSNYMQQIEQYLQFFPKESFLFLFMEDLIHKPAETMYQICRFLSLDDQFDWNKINPIVANQTRQHTKRFIRSRMTAPLRAISSVARIATFLPKTVRNRIYQGLRKLPYYEKWIKKQYIPPPMRPETRQMLLEQFREPNRKLAEFLNRDLSHWSK